MMRSILGRQMDQEGADIGGSHTAGFPGLPNRCRARGLQLLAGFDTESRDTREVHV